jgi:hypothetical protein
VVANLGDRDAKLGDRDAKLGVVAASMAPRFDRYVR